MEPEERALSAVVTLRPPDHREASAAAGPEGEEPDEELRSRGFAVDADHAAAGPAAVPEEIRVVDRVKAFFTRAGFEVHAPLGSTFSIGAKRQLFEEFFGRGLDVDPDAFPSAVTVEGGGADLPLDPLPDEVRAVVQSISFPAPPALPGLP